ncbi:RNA polymerase III transcription factor tfiiic [Apiospora hydei]|uniref:RNA polymerase III transcription factor tfiiic n=1 Tax=Apiospora hydei TaxID=1337664 RepID=A0ABR1X999_9PEZI
MATRRSRRFCPISSAGAVPRGPSVPPEGLRVEEPAEENDALLEAQKQALGTFEDSVRNFVNARDIKKAVKFGLDDDPQAAADKAPRIVKKRGPRKAAEPTGDVKMRLNYATTAYMEGRLDDALNYVEDAIRINGEIHRAWTLLASILQDRGEVKQGLLALVCAAHLEPKIVTGWVHCAQLALQLLDSCPEDFEDVSKIGLMALSQAIRIEPDNIATRLGRADLYFARESYKHAIGEYQLILEQTPYDLAVLRGLVEAAVQLSMTRKKGTEKPQYAAKEAYQRGIEHYRSEFELGSHDPNLPLTWDDFIMYIELLHHLKQWEDVISQTKLYARWLLGRRDESFWDSIQDDREWDNYDHRRNEMIPDYAPGKHPMESYGLGLPLRLRAKLAICRLHLKQDDEAMHHLEWFEPIELVPDDEQYSDIFAEIAGALYEHQHFPRALRFYDPLRHQEGYLDAAQLYQVGKCYLEAGNKRDAEDYFAAALDAEESTIDTRISARYELAKMYEEARQGEEAYILVNEAMELERDRDENLLYGDGDGAYRPRRPLKAKRKPAGPRKPRVKGEKASRPSGPRRPREPKEPRTGPKGPYKRRVRIFALNEDREREENARSAHLATKWEIVRAGNHQTEELSGGPGEEWMAAAKELIEDFCSFKAFFPWERYLVNIGLKQDKAGLSSTNPTLLKMAQRLKDSQSLPEPSFAYYIDSSQAAEQGNRVQSNLEKRVHENPVEYRDVTFPEWLDLFVGYALALAQVGQTKEAYKICESAKDANVFFEDTANLFLIHIAMAACALRARDEEKCVEVARYIMSKNQFSTDGYRVYAAICRLCSSTAGWYADSRVQKFTLRQIKMMDAALLPPEQKDKSLEGQDVKVYPGKELDATLLMMYGHILFVSNSFTYALNYFIRAHAREPNNPMVNISIGLAYVHYSLKRQAENRQYLIVQGLTFLHKYYDQRLASAENCSMQRQEAHYNLARSYHQLGLTHLAIQYYRLVLREIEANPPAEKEEEMGEEGERGVIMRRRKMENLAQEAAYNIQNCCLIGGDMIAARSVAGQHLVL